MGGGDERCGTEIQDPDGDISVVSACVEHEDGTPAINARVLVFSDGAGASGKAAAKAAGSALSDTELVTDRQGAFRITHLPLGPHRIFISVPRDTTVSGGREAVSYMAKVTIEEKKQHILLGGGVVRLAPEGVITGAVLDLTSKAGLPGAQCQVVGTEWTATTNDDGVFSFFLPAGAYDVRCSNSPWTTGERKDIVVEVGKPTSFTMFLARGESSFPLPTITLFSAKFDSVTGVVSLSWSKAVSHELVNYIVRRTDPASLDFQTIPVQSPNTTYFDAAFGGSPDSVFEKDLWYSVACTRTDGTIGPYTSLRLKVARGPIIDDTLRRLGDGSKYKVGDTAWVEGRYSGRARLNAKVAWSLKGSSEVLRTTLVSNRAGADTLAFPCRAAGDFEIRMSVTDDAGVVAWKSWPLHIDPGP